MLKKLEQTAILAILHYFPSVYLNNSITRGNSSFASVSPQTIAQGGFDTTWEIDIFGSNRAAVDSAEALFMSSQALAKDIEKTIIADLVRAIIEWHQANQTLIKTKKLLKAQNNEVIIFKSRVQAGLINASFLERALAQKEQTSIQIPLAKAAIKKTQYQIENLIGQKPGSLTKILAKYKNFCFKNT